MGGGGGGGCRSSKKFDCVIHPKVHAISHRNFKNSVLLRDDLDEEPPCEVIAYQTDARERHVRNRRLLDSTFTSPRCCSNLYNAMVDKMKLKRLQRYGLSRSVRPVKWHLDGSEPMPCDLFNQVLVSNENAREEKEQEEGEMEEELEEEEEEREEPNVHVVRECYEVSPSVSSIDLEEVQYVPCESGSMSVCSGCSTFGGVMRQKFHRVPKLRWQDLLKAGEIQHCMQTVEEILTKYKGKPGALLKLKREPIYRTTRRKPCV